MTRLNRIESRKITRHRLARSVEQGLLLKGVSGMAVDRIAREAGYSRGAFYANFDDWADLLIDLLKGRQERDLQFWNTIFQDAVDIEVSLLRVIELSQQIAPASSIISIELQLEAERSEKFRPHFEAYLDTIQIQIGELFIMLLKRHGKAPPDDLRARVFAIHSVGLHLGLGSSAGSVPFTLDQKVALLRSLVTDMIANAPLLPA